MPNRPADWSPLGLDADPVPANPALLADIERDFRRMSDEAELVNAGLDAVLRAAENGGFVGRTAEVLREEISGRLKKFIANLAFSFDVAAGAVAQYRRAVDTAQAATAKSLGDAHALVAAAGGDAAPQGGLRLAALRAQAETERDWLVREAVFLERRLREAADLVSQPIKVRSGFLKVLWTIIQWTGMALSLIAVITGGPLALVAFAINAAIFLKTAIDYAQGRTNGLGLGLAFLGVLFPSTRGIGVKTVLSPIMAAARGIAGAVRATVQAALSLGRAGLVAGVRATGGFLVGAGRTTLDFVTSLPGLAVRGIRAVPG